MNCNSLYPIFDAWEYGVFRRCYHEKNGLCSFSRFSTAHMWDLNVGSLVVIQVFSFTQCSRHITHQRYVSKQISGWVVLIIMSHLPCHPFHNRKSIVIDALQQYLNAFQIFMEQSNKIYETNPKKVYTVGTLPLTV